MRKVHVLLAVLLCGLLSAGIRVRASGTHSPPRFATRAQLGPDRLQVPHQEGEPAINQLVARDGQWAPRVPVHPDLPAAASLTLQSAATPAAPATQNDAAARAYLRHLHPTHDFP
ncbi:MAG: hypothetical protein EOO11_03225 [Chitinophagaceae bacterium]|nr:MAG: hypothetical protein EOO11_03225 [Chitinophagaceae bacterium]